MKDLRDFIKLLQAGKELVHIDAEVDAVLEISEITDRVSKRGGPALLFNRPKGHRVPILTNQFGSESRMAAALRCSSLEELAGRIAELTALEMPQGFGDRLRALGRLRSMAGFGPRTIKEGLCQEIVYRGEDVDLGLLPVLTCWPGDGGPFITLPVVFTKHPVTGRRNAGMYRLQVFNHNTTGMHWHIHKDAAEHYRRSPGRLEVAVAIGTDPAVTYAATAPLPGGLDEMLFAGFLRGGAVEMVRCVSVDLEVPAHTEFVLEGYVDPDETRLEGPFGDHTGFYSPAAQYPVFHVTALTHRKDPIYAATLVGIPPMEDCYLAKATERLFLPLLRLTLPEVVDMDLPAAGVFHNCAILSIRKAYPMHARKIMHAVWGTGQMQFTKCVIVVDEDVDVHDYQSLAFHVFSNVDPKRDFLFTEGPLDILDHSSPHEGWGSKVGIDATRTWPQEGHQRVWPEKLVMDPEVRARIDTLWPQLGLDGPQQLLRRWIHRP
ncbi:MAG: menaquinone biosynthesis decarboxylase [Actinobacteria bacterium]|nr:menaquinone biosynthesis decarboxylase [Actinomycetota bacterium]